MRVAFDEFELDAQRRELLCRGKPLAVEPKVFDLLVFLVDNRDRVVSKGELIEKVWQGRIVSDAALDTCIKTARRVVGDNGKSQRLIRTVARRGIRFVADATERNAIVSLLAQPPGDVTSQPTTGVQLDALTLTLPDQPSIAVLPFESINAGDNRYTIAEGLFRDITTRLGRTRWLFVIARGSASRFTASQIHEAGSKLAVRYIVQGSVQSRGRKVRVNVTLIDTVEGTEVWADTFDRALDDIFAVQDEIADAIVQRVQSELELSERRRALLKPLSSLTAWSAYHRACWHYDRHTPNGYDQAEQLFLRAASLDSTSARVFAGLSSIHHQRAFMELTSDRAGELRHAYDLAQQSLALDPNDPQGHWVMGRIQKMRNELGASIAEFEIASLLNPSFAMGRYSFGLSSALLGESASSDAALRAACRLSPIDPMRHGMIATQAFNAAHEGDHDRAAALAALAASQPTAHYLIVAIAAMCSALAGRHGPSEHYLKKLRIMRPDYTSGLFLRAFPFQCQEHQALWKKSCALLGLPE
ncbi:MAG: winged helix-turn-helix domain-containing protein [Hyphomicrobiaceae bacterium]